MLLASIAVTTAGSHVLAFKGTVDADATALIDRITLF
jgi:hypothetical protein